MIIEDGSGFREQESIRIAIHLLWLLLSLFGMIICTVDGQSLTATSSISAWAWLIGPLQILGMRTWPLRYNFINDR